MSTKIQINSLAALERLIGGDSELEIEVRNSVVQNFTKKYLKDVANSEIVKVEANLVKREVYDSVFKKRAYGYHEVMTQEMQELIRATAKDVIENGVREIVHNAVTKEELTKQVDECVNDAVRFITERLRPEVLNRRVELLVNNRLKEKLGI